MYLLRRAGHLGAGRVVVSARSTGAPPTSFSKLDPESSKRGLEICSVAPLLGADSPALFHLTGMAQNDAATFVQIKGQGDMT
jgi:hypothetical protein